MTENEAKKNLETYIYSELENTPKQLLEALKIACQALGEIQQYRKHNITVEGSLDTMRDLSDVTEAIRQYWAIGTPEECRAAVEKQKAKTPIRNDKCTCPSCGTHNEVFKKRRNTVAHDIVYCWHCGQAVEIDRLEE